MGATVRKLFAVSTFALALVSSAPSFAGPDLEPLLDSLVGRFLMTETTAGRGVVSAAIGRELSAGEGLDPFRDRMGEPDMAASSGQLEARIREIEHEFRREFPETGDQMGPEQRALLRALAQNELHVEMAGDFESNRVSFLRAAAPAAGLEPRLRFPFGVRGLTHPEARLQFGFESEYTMNDLSRLLTAYGPAPEFGIPADEWLQKPIAERVQWVKDNVQQLFPNLREMGGLVKVTPNPRLDFLPERLLRDSTGNLEIVLGPVDTFEQWQRNIFLLNEELGVGSMQGTVSVPRDAFFGKASPHAPATMVRDDLGFFNFNNDFDTLQKLEVGAQRYAVDPTKPAANSFNHPFLGPMTQLKQGMLVRYLHANANGALLDAEARRLVSAVDNSFKYTGGTAYRPDIVPDRTVLEIRDAHTNTDALMDRMGRAMVFLQRGRAAFAGAADLKAFDSVGDFNKLPHEAQAMLKQLFPAKMLPGVEYTAEERLAVEVYRNFAYPMRDWSRQLEFVGDAGISARVTLAQRNYSARLAQIAQQLSAGGVTAQQASLQVQGAVANFAVESGLADAYRDFARRTLEQAAPEAAGHLRDAG